MLTAERASWWRPRWDVARDGVPVTRLDGSAWGSGGTLEMAGRTYTMRAGRLGLRCALHEGGPDGPVVALAERVGRKDWQVTHDGVVHAMRRGSIWRGDHALLDDAGNAVGVVRGVGRWYQRAEADLPGLPEPVAVFVLCVVLLQWDQMNAAAAAAT